MIRERNARTDDEEIIRLIKSELMPLSWTTHQHDATVIRELPLRLRRGVTYVAAAGKTAAPYGFIHFETVGDILMFPCLPCTPSIATAIAAQSLWQQPKLMAWQLPVRWAACSLIKSTISPSIFIPSSDIRPSDIIPSFAATK